MQCRETPGEERPGLEDEAGRIVELRLSDGGDPGGE
jgi:hypothetical protein